jgi:hypothetical protein
LIELLYELAVIENADDFLRRRRIQNCVEHGVTALPDNQAHAACRRRALAQELEAVELRKAVLTGADVFQILVLLNVDRRRDGTIAACG